MKHLGVVFAVLLLALSVVAMPGGNKHQEKYFLTDWDSINVSATATFVKLDAIWIASPGSNDTLYIALNGDTTATGRFKLQPSTTKYITKENVKYIKIRAGSDSVYACIDIY